MVEENETGKTLPEVSLSPCPVLSSNLTLIHIYLLFLCAIDTTFGAIK